MKKGGTGGSNTNKNGLSFEKRTDLAKLIKRDLPKYTVTPMTWRDAINNLHFKINNPKRKRDLSKQIGYQIAVKSTDKVIGYVTRKHNFYKYLKGIYNIENTNSKEWRPDDVFFDLRRNAVVIIEKKFQSKTGSVDEKPLSFASKRRLYQRLLNHGQPKAPMGLFIFIGNSEWWSKPVYNDTFDILREDGVEFVLDTYDYSWLGL